MGVGGRLWREPGTLLRGDSRAGTGKNALTFFREVNKVRECGWDPVYLTPAPPGDPEPRQDNRLEQNQPGLRGKGPGGEGQGKVRGPGSAQTPWRAGRCQRRDQDSRHSSVTLSRSPSPPKPGCPLLPVPWARWPHALQ